MKTLFKNSLIFALFSGFILTSCSKEEDPYTEPLSEAVNFKASIKTNKLDVRIPSLKTTLPEGAMFNDFPFDPFTVVEPSECSTTPFDDVINASIQSNIDQLGADFFGLYAQMNFFYTLTDESRQYFGKRGQYTFLVKRFTKGLERFWKMRKEVSVRGQHNRTLNDKEKIIDILNFWFIVEPGEPELLADFFVDVVNPESTFLIETPLISFDGFAIALDGAFGQGDIIVIGDGLVELASEAGVETRIVWKGILSHEWAHQIQFNNFDVWYPDGAADNVPEATRTTELEADYFTGYYLTHRMGGTHSWYRTKQFLELFYNIGDCSFESDGHHGTPQQRMEAAKRGYKLAKRNFRKRGHGYYNTEKFRYRPFHVLNADEVHEEFLDELDEIVSGGGGDIPVNPFL